MPGNPVIHRISQNRGNKRIMKRIQKRLYLCSDRFCPFIIADLDICIEILFFNLRIAEPVNLSGGNGRPGICSSSCIKDFCTLFHQLLNLLRIRQHISCLTADFGQKAASAFRC